jgi:hypothetical protein
MLPLPWKAIRLAITHFRMISLDSWAMTGSQVSPQFIQIRSTSPPLAEALAIIMIAIFRRFLPQI